MSRRTSLFRVLLVAIPCALGTLLACADASDPARLDVRYPDAGRTEPPSQSGSSGSSGSSMPDGNGDVTDPFAAGVSYFADLAYSGTAAAHAAATPPAPEPDADLRCLDCHAAGADGATQKFVLAGYVSDGDGACSGCDVFTVDERGHRVRARTAADGTFAVTATEYGTVSANTHVGVRKGAAQKVMGGTIDEQRDGGVRLQGCQGSSCHTADLRAKPN